MEKNNKIPIYPDINDPKFYKKILEKKEFARTKVDTSVYEGDRDELVSKMCNQDTFMLQPFQEFVRNFISPYTPYNGMLAFWGVGVGKTCMAVQVAEGLKEMTVKHNKKIYILAKKSLQYNFKKELYNESKEKKEKYPGSLQCTGDTYYVSVKEEPNYIKRKKKINDKIKENYDFFTFGKFVNYIDRDVIENQGIAGLAFKFSNSVIIIDEAHSLTGEKKKRGNKFNIDDEDDIFADEEDEYDMYDDDEDNEKIGMKISNRGILAILSDILRNSKNVKLLLLTATPMKDDPTEIVDLINLLRLNDNKQAIDLVFSDLFDGIKGDYTQSRLREDKLIEYTKGYISYVRGENPITFPSIIDIDKENHNIVINSNETDEVTIISANPNDERYIEGGINNIIYKPKPLYYENMTLIPKELHDTYIEYFELLRCPMSKYQFIRYREVIKRYLKSHNKSSTDDSYDSSNIDHAGRSSSYIIFPSYPGIDKDEILAGNSGFNKIFNKYKSNPVGNEVKSKTVYKYRLNRNIPKDYINFLKYNEIGKYSSKFFGFLTHLFNSEGKVFAYSDLKLVGALMVAFMLEMNGYLKYSHGSIKNEQNLLSSEYIPQDVHRCICGELKSNHNESITHTFKQAYYVLFTGDKNDIRMDEEIKMISNDKNLYGELIKVIIGTCVAAEGIDYSALREVHIIAPWHNSTRLYQVIGRALRNCGHKDLPSSKRNVKIFRYSACAPIVYEQELIKKQKYVSTLDEHYDNNIDKLDTLIYSEGFSCKMKELYCVMSDEKVYNRIEKKDIFIKNVERKLKEVAVDCYLTKDLNIFGLTKYNDYKRECDYKKCEYKCYTGTGLDYETFTKSNEKEFVIKPENIDDSTYSQSSFFYEPQIRYIKQILFDIFKYSGAVNEKLLIKYIQKFDNKIDAEIIYEALDRITGNSILYKPDVFVDVYDRKGFLIKTGYNKEVYYIFQPDEIKDKTIPMYYKMTPLTDKQEEILIEFNATSKKDIEIVSNDLLMADFMNLCNDYKKMSEDKLYNKYKLCYLHYKLDRFTHRKMSKILEMIISKYYISTVSELLEMELETQVTTEIIKYLHTCKVLIYTIKNEELVYIITKLNPSEIANFYRKYENGVWLDIREYDLTIQQKNLFVQPQYNFNNIFGIIIYDKTATKFKILNSDQKNAKYNQPSSLRTILKGQECCTLEKNVLQEYVINIHKLLIESSEKYMLSESNIKTLKKESICYNIEIMLRYLNIIKYKDLTYVSQNGWGTHDLDN